MESITIPEVRSTNSFNDEFQKLHLAPENDNGSSFTALLELPSNQAMELLTDDFHADVVKRHRISAFNNSTLSSRPPAFPSSRALIERAAKYSVFANDDSVELKVKSEPLDSGSNPNSSDPMAGSESDKEKPLKRKEREKKGKGSSKKNKTTSDDGEKLPYVHVRARRGQATDSHSLAERARREKINARMKLLQELVPGCNKISGTAMVLDEIINHVQWLQRQVEHLSMRLAAVNPKIDFNLDSLISGTESMMECNYPNMAMPIMWPEIHVNGDRQQIQPQSYLESSSQPEIYVNGDRQQNQPQSYLQSSSQPVWVKEENQCNLVASENSLMTFDLPPNSASLHTNQLKMEL